MAEKSPQVTWARARREPSHAGLPGEREAAGGGGGAVPSTPGVAK